jgi:hypothetical protein
LCAVLPRSAGFLKYSSGRLAGSPLTDLSEAIELTASRLANRGPTPVFFERDENKTKEKLTE